MTLTPAEIKDRISEAAPGVFRIRVPLPKNPLKELNAYFVRALPGGRNLLVDTGFNRVECEEALRGALAELGADMKETDIFITHMHSDHCGLVNRIADESSKIYCSRADAAIINDAAGDTYWDELDELFATYGYPRKRRQNREKHPGWEFNVREPIEFTFANEGAIIEAGKYLLRTVWTPGHTPGHMCLYDERFGLLFCADHVLGDITPNITIENGMENPLRLYFDSLDKVSALKVDTVLTGHRNPPASFAGRVAQLRAHHIERLEEVMAILNGHAMTAYEVAGKMTWDISCENWDAFPPSQKWFATGEAIAHLQYLHTEGRIGKYMAEGVWWYAKL
ncbi:MAG: MBL fold metallo-hydrolase [Clostridiales Family XIII bacterium]|jgi:glyoxylase-like metal-dependent hydrolase (beta-lactamase superfamily II)|nr:MBL fold metallo-hydrolase [Clostridiales Family XIII bacterium]